MQRIQKLLFALLFALFILTPVVSFAQNTSATLPQVERIDTQAELVKLKQLQEKELRDRISELKNENDSLSSEILELEKNRVEATEKIKQLDEVQEGVAPNQNISTAEEIEEEIKEAQLQLANAEKELALKRSTLEANKAFIAEAEIILLEKQNEIESEVSNLQSQIFSLASPTTLYIGLVVLYIALFNIFSFLIRKFVHQPQIKLILRFLVTSLFWIALIATIVYAFIGNLTYLLTGLGVISAALVVALQDYVSSFFSWIQIRLRGLYKKRDVISFNNSHGKSSGIVEEITLFRTYLKEIEGLDGGNSERQTGKIISVPNNSILKDSIVNFTRDNKILWHKIELVITFESDLDLAEKIVHKICDEQHKYMLDHKDTFYDDVFNLKYTYRPRVYIDINDNGPRFTVWYAARFGHHREVLERYSKEFLKDFATYGIDLAYRTTRVYSTIGEHGGKKQFDINFSPL